MRHEEADHITPQDTEPPADDDAEILLGFEQRLESILAGVREARRSIKRLAALERAAAIRDLARLAGDSGDAQHVARHALEALAAQLGGADVATRRDLEAVRRRPPRLRFEWWHAALAIPGLAALATGYVIHDVAKAPAFIGAGATLLAVVLGNSFRPRSGQ